MKIQIAVDPAEQPLLCAPAAAGPQHHEVVSTTFDFGNDLVATALDGVRNHIVRNQLPRLP